MCPLPLTGTDAHHVRARQHTAVGCSLESSADAARPAQQVQHMANAVKGAAVKDQAISGSAARNGALTERKKMQIDPQLAGNWRFPASKSQSERRLSLAAPAAAPHDADSALCQHRVQQQQHAATEHQHDDSAQQVITPRAQQADSNQVLTSETVTSGHHRLARVPDWAAGTSCDSAST